MEMETKKLKLKWFIRKYYRRGREDKVYYIHIPKTIGELLSEYEPYLDLEHNVILLKKKEN